MKRIGLITFVGVLVGLMALPAVAQGERPGRGRVNRQRLLERFDTNKNGRIDPEERAAAQEKMRELREGRERPGGKEAREDKKADKGKAAGKGKKAGEGKEARKGKEGADARDARRGRRARRERGAEHRRGEEADEPKRSARRERRGRPGADRRAAPGRFGARQARPGRPRQGGAALRQQRRGPGAPNALRFQMRYRLLRLFDRNRDGRLNPMERAHARAAIRRHLQQRRGDWSPARRPQNRQEGRGFQPQRRRPAA